MPHARDERARRLAETVERTDFDGIVHVLRKLGDVKPKALACRFALRHARIRGREEFLHERLRAVLRHCADLIVENPLASIAF